MDFPLTDCDGTRVVRDRRSGADRRKAAASLEELLVLFSQLPSEDPGRSR